MYDQRIQVVCCSSSLIYALSTETAREESQLELQKASEIHLLLIKNHNACMHSKHMPPALLYNFHFVVTHRLLTDNKTTFL